MVFPEAMKSTMLALETSINGHAMPINNVMSKISKAKGHNSPRSARGAFNKKFVINQGATTLKLSKNTMVIIEDKTTQDHEYNLTSSLYPMPPPHSLRDHFKTITKFSDRSWVNKGIKVNKMHKKQLTTKKREEETNFFVKINPFMTKLKEFIEANVSLIPVIGDALQEDKT